MSRVSSVYNFESDPSSYAAVYRNLPAAMEVHEPPTDPPTPIRDVICGSTKMVGGCLAFPVLCPLNFVAGTFMTAYGCLCCRIGDRAFENRRNEFCAGCGIVPSARVSTSLFQTGLNEIRRPCCVTQEMVR